MATMDDDDHEETGGDEDFLGDLAGTLGGLSGSGAVVRVDRVLGNGKLEFVDELPAEAFGLKGVQENYGGGEYLINARRGGRFVQGLRNKRINIAQPIARQPAAPDASVLGDVARAMREGFEHQSKTLAAVVAQLAPRQESRAQVLEELRTMRDIFGPSGGGGSNLGTREFLDILNMGMDLGKSAGGGDEGLTGVLSAAIEKFGEPLALALTQAREQPRAPAPRVTRAPAAPIAPAATAPAAPKPEPKDNGGNMQIKIYMGMLIGQAARNVDPGTVADLILQNIDEEEIRTFLGDGDPVEKLAAVDKRVRDHVEWFRELGSELKSLIDGVDPGSAESQAAGDQSPGGNP